MHHLHTRRSLVLAILLLTNPPAHAETQTTANILLGEAKPIGAITETALSKLSFAMERCGPIFRTTWYAANDTLLATDELEADDNGLKRYRYSRPNVQEWARAVRQGDTLLIEHSEGGRVRNAKLPASRATVVGPMIALLAQQQYQQLKAGERLHVRYAVPDRLAAYDFTLMDAVSSRDRLREVAVVADSWVVRQVTKPVTLYFNDGGQFVGMRGRALPARGEPGRRQPLELDARVLRRETRACSAEPRDDAWFRNK